MSSHGIFKDLSSGVFFWGEGGEYLLTKMVLILKNATRLQHFSLRASVIDGILTNSK